MPPTDQAAEDLRLTRAGCSEQRQTEREFVAKALVYLTEAKEDVNLQGPGA